MVIENLTISIMNQLIEDGYRNYAYICICI